MTSATSNPTGNVRCPPTPSLSEWTVCLAQGMYLKGERHQLPVAPERSPVSDRRHSCRWRWGGCTAPEYIHPVWTTTKLQRVASACHATISRSCVGVIGFDVVATICVAKKETVISMRKLNVHSYVQHSWENSTPAKMNPPSPQKSMQFGTVILSPLVNEDNESVRVPWVSLR